MKRCAYCGSTWDTMALETGGKCPSCGAQVGEVPEPEQEVLEVIFFDNLETRQRVVRGRASGVVRWEDEVDFRRTPQQELHRLASLYPRYAGLLEALA